MDLWIARQPLLTKALALYGYRLECRPGLDGLPPLDPTVASAQLIAATVAQLGLEELTGGARALIPVSRALLVGQYGALLPQDHTVLEVAGDVPADSAAVLACTELKRAGYALAVPAAADPARNAARLAWADLLIVDARTAPLPARDRLCRREARRPATLLAAHLATPARFEAAVAAGYDLFHGPFFTCPSPIRSAGIPTARLRYLSLLEAVLAPEVDLRQVADLIARDAALAYALLRYINSAFFAFPRPIGSVLEGLLLLGERAVVRWACLMNLAALGAQAPTELLVECAVRARLCELIAQHCREPVAAGEAFFVGLFSLLEVLLHRPMSAIVAEVPLPAGVKAALLGVRNPLRDVLDCVLAYVAAEWETFAARLAPLGPVPSEVPRRYREAVAWARDVLPMACAQQ